jgi:hypothetical protein
VAAEGERVSNQAAAETLAAQVGLEQEPAQPG